MEDYCARLGTSEASCSLSQVAGQPSRDDPAILDISMS